MSIPVGSGGAGDGEPQSQSDHEGGRYVHRSSFPPFGSKINRRGMTRSRNRVILSS